MIKKVGKWVPCVNRKNQVPSRPLSKVPWGTATPISYTASGWTMSTKDIRELSGTLSVVRPTFPQVKKGVCYVLFAFELGLSVNLDEAARTIKQGYERTKFRRTSRAPKYFDYDPPPLRISQHGQQINVAKFFTKSQADLTLFDFGACSVCYEVDVSGPVGNLIELSEVLYDNAHLLADAKERVQGLLSELGTAISRPNLHDSVEDFTVYHIQQFDGGAPPERLFEEHPKELARILRAESNDLADEEVREAISTRTAYSTSDHAVIDWNSAMYFGSNSEDFVAVLEFCNVELLEMRFLDEQLDDRLEQAYQILTTGKKGGADLSKIARLQVDSAILYEAVENALKLLGDQYLARVYSLASAKFHLPEWNSSILRKLDTLDSIYHKMSDRAAQKRSEVLEWVVIALISFEIILGIFEKIVK